MSARRLPRPVSASVSASWRLATSMPAFSRRLRTRRAKTASSEAAASTTASEFSEPSAARTRMPRPRRGEGDREGGEAHRPAVLDGHRAARGLPGGGREEHQARGPAAVPQARVDVGLVGDGDEVVGVGDPEEHDAQAQQRPGAIGAPAAQREGGDDDREQDEVADRVGEVRGDAERVAADRVQHGLQDDRGAHGAGGERGGQPVDPQRLRRPLDPRAQQQAQAGEDERVEGQVAGVGDRRHGDDGVVGEDERPVDVAAGPQQRAGADEAPAPGPRARARECARQSVSSDAPMITIQ